jgi:long-chain fatty acid transport protein
VGDAHAAGFGLAGVGARANGLGGAFHAVADDATAIYWNPAALSTFNGWQGTLGSSFIALTGEFKPIDPIAGYDERISSSLDADVAPVPYGMIAWGNGSIGGGIGFYVPHGLKLGWDLYDLPHGYNNDLTYPRNDWTVDLSLIDIQPTVAIKVNDRVHFGVGAVLHVADAILQKPQLSPTGLDDPTDYLVTDVVIDGSAVGFDAVLSFLVRPFDRLDLGLVYRLGSTVTIDGDATFSSYMPSLFPYVYGTPAQVTVKTPAETDLAIPGSVAFGAAFHPTDNLLLSASFTWTEWSKFESLYLDFQETDLDGKPIMVAGLSPVEDSSLNYGWDDTWRLSLGSELDAGRFSLRAGYFYETTATQDQTMSPLIPDVNDQHSLNAGIGFAITDRVRIDAIGEYFLEMTRDITSHFPVDTSSGDMDNLPGHYTAAVNAFNIQLSYGI